LRLSPRFHTLCVDGQEDIEQLVERVSKRILRFLQRRGVITLVGAPGDGEVTVVPDETLGEQDPLLAKLLAAATTGAAPAGPVTKRQPIRIVLDPDDRPVGKGVLCGQSHAFNLQAATRVAADAKPGRERLAATSCARPLANDRLHIVPDGAVRLDFKKPWSDGTRSPRSFGDAGGLASDRPLSAVDAERTPLGRQPASASAD
jgi:hypothetical protein